ncbi:adenosine deaminase-like isoform X2 [Ornithodoros turicata]|uniref:adenosine deaminase-like isoform X2 n=1 Tax=Ornithodoros turicata TaxID=34597 RepID=UPI003138AC3C
MHGSRRVRALLVFICFYAECGFQDFCVAFARINTPSYATRSPSLNWEKPKHRIQLHVHLDGHLRHSTIWELESKKKLGLGYESVEDIKNKTKPSEGTTLKNYLKEMPRFLRLLVGDRDAMTRVAYEAGVDQAKDGIIYSEMRIFPYMMATDHTHLQGYTGNVSTLRSPCDVIQAILDGFKKAEAEHDIKLRLILACFRDKPEWSRDILTLVDKFKDKGVVGIDVAGVFDSEPTERDGEEILSEQVIKTFQEAEKRGIHRTAHAGEAGPPGNIIRAINELKAERIGHGYSAIREGGEAYRLALCKGIHFEENVSGSYLTGAVQKDETHPIFRLIHDKASFSINTDDPTITQVTLEHEYKLLRSLGATLNDIIDSNLSAIKAAFLPEKEKQELLKKFERLNGL